MTPDEGKRETNPHRAGEIVTETAKVEQVWRCMGNGEMYVSPKCGFGHEHRLMTVTTTVTMLPKVSDA